jgi:EAL domain-containing protein (putative c-di-GMP-specific phosphodiesterase class I)/GGDEF domain-containing protein
MADRGRTSLNLREPGARWRSADQVHDLHEVGALNRRAFLARADYIRRRWPEGETAFITIGVERFSRIRGSIGYTLAESVISHLAARARKYFHGAPITRLGPDMVGLAMVKSPSVETWANQLQGLQNVLEQPILAEGAPIRVSVRIGYVTVTGGLSVAGGDLLNQAEIALDQARETSRLVQRFSPEQYGDPLGRLSLLTDLRDSLVRNELRLVYQPQVRCRSGEVVSAEALMRWEHPARGMVSPADFIPVAEETGMIGDLTLWAISQALRDLEIISASGRDMRIAVNFSGRLLSDQGFIELVRDRIRGRENQLTLEITESSEIEDWAIALKSLEAFAAAGMRISIDDYGSGLSSLAYVRQLPAHELKIDRMFVSQLTESYRDPLLVRSTIELGHALELEVVAEGIEDVETLALLSMMGCDMVQGYHLARPMKLDALLSYLEADRARDIIEAPMDMTRFWGVA